MSATRDVRDPATPTRIAIVASNPAVSTQTGWPIGFWWSELVHPYWEFVEHGYEVDVYSPDGGALEGDSFSDPRDESGYSSDDLLSLGFISSPAHRALVEQTPPISELDLDRYHGVLFVGGQGPMYTFYEDSRVHELCRDSYSSGTVTGVICHATCILLKTRLASGDLLVDGKTWTGFANSEEDFADSYAQTTIQPFRIEDEARALPGTNFIVQGAFKPFAVREGHLVTGQQQYSGTAAARLMIEALGV